MSWRKEVSRVQVYCEVGIDAEPTYTIEVHPVIGSHEGCRFTGLNKSAVDFVHACLNAGWTTKQVSDHLNEMLVAQWVNDAAAVRDAEVRALGFSLDEVQEFARNIQSRLFNAAVTEDGEEEEIIAQELVRLLIRRTLRDVVPNLQKMPGTPYNPDRIEFIMDGMRCGKPDLSIDTSQVEMRLLAHLARKQETDREQRRPEA